MSKSKVKVGTQFYHFCGDGISLWEVKKYKGSGVWIAEIINDPDNMLVYEGKVYDADYKGVTNIFTTETILIRMEQYK